MDDHEVPAGIHTKSFVIDGQQALIGSFNFDPRSRDLNSEIGLLIDGENRYSVVGKADDVPQYVITRIVVTDRSRLGPVDVPAC